MTFAGWTLSQLGVLFGVGAGAITLLYLLRMRRRQVVVPFAALWEQVTRESESRQIWRKLRRLLSWLVQLIVLALLCAALGDPRPDVWLRDPVTVAVVIDASASMAGAAQGEDGEEGQRRIDVAKARAIEEVRGLGPVDKGGGHRGGRGGLGGRGAVGRSHRARAGDRVDRAQLRRVRPAARAEPGRPRGGGQAGASDHRADRRCLRPGRRRSTDQLRRGGDRVQRGVDPRPDPQRRDHGLRRPPLPRGAGQDRGPGRGPQPRRQPGRCHPGRRGGGRVRRQPPTRAAGGPGHPGG